MKIDIEKVRENAKKIQTLEDIPFDMNDDISDFKEELRKRAIKTIKELKRNPDLANKQFTDRCDFQAEVIIGWIKHFFNLTPKDLGENEDDTNT